MPLPFKERQCRSHRLALGHLMSLVADLWCLPITGDLIHDSEIGFGFRDLDSLSEIIVQERHGSESIGFRY